MPAAFETPDLLVGEVFDHRRGAGIAAEEVLAHERPGLGLERLVVPVRGGVHQRDQGAVGVGGEQRVPLPAPDHLDDVPARAPEVGLQLLDDVAVAADRAVEALQVAVDHEGEVVQLLAGGHADGAQRLGFVHLAVTQERPHPLSAGVGDAPGVQVAVEPGLVDRVERAQAHRHGRELPELRHQPRMGVRRQTGTRTSVGELLTEAVELIFGQPSFQERASVDAR